jgi:SPP1 family predicted phage head-tail adaptor
MRYQQDISPQMRVRFDGVIYNIAFVSPVVGSKRYLDLYCRTVNNDGI